MTSGTGAPRRWDMGMALLLVVASVPVAATDAVKVGIDLTQRPGAPGPLAFAMAVAQSVPLVWRRRMPCTVAAVVGAVFLLRQGLPVARSPADLALLPALAAVGVASSRRRVATVGAIGTAAAAGLLVLGPRPADPGTLADFVALILLVVLVPLAIGRAQRRQDRRLLDAGHPPRTAPHGADQAHPTADGARPASAAGREHGDDGAPAGRARGPAASPGDPAVVLAGLTPREREVYLLVAQGLTNEQVAVRLRVGRETVKTHVRSILAKRNLTTRHQVTADAYACALLVAEPAPQPSGSLVGPPRPIT